MGHPIVNVGTDRPRAQPHPRHRVGDPIPQKESECIQYWNFLVKMALFFSISEEIGYKI
jgi:hypothetical protein